MWPQPIEGRTLASGAKTGFSKAYRVVASGTWPCLFFMFERLPDYTIDRLLNFLKAADTLNLQQTNLFLSRALARQAHITRRLLREWKLFRERERAEREKRRNISLLPRPPSEPFEH